MCGFEYENNNGTVFAVNRTEKQGRFSAKLNQNMNLKNSKYE